MKERALNLPEIMLIAGTRVALGAGIGFLVGNKLDNNQRRAAGIALFAVGLLSSIPLVIDVVSKKDITSGEKWRQEREELERQPVTA